MQVEWWIGDTQILPAVIKFVSSFRGSCETFTSFNFQNDIYFVRNEVRSPGVHSVCLLSFAIERCFPHYCLLYWHSINLDITGSNTGASHGAGGEENF